MLAGMNSQFSLGRLLDGIAVVAMMTFAARYAMTQAIHTAIASQPPAQNLAAAPAFDFSGCDFGTSLGRPWQYGDPSASRPCQVELKPPPVAAAPIPAMTKTESETASLWFLFAALLVPLGLGGAMAVTFWVVKD